MIERLSGEDLYKKYPIGNYYQQGDRLFMPQEGIKESFTWDTLDSKTKIRLRKGWIGLESI